MFLSQKIIDLFDQKLILVQIENKFLTKMEIEISPETRAKVPYDAGCRSPINLH